MATHDEETAHLGTLLVAVDELRRRKASKVAQLRAQHNRHQTETPLDSLWRVVTNLKHDNSMQLAAVADRTLTALGWIKWLRVVSFVVDAFAGGIHGFAGMDRVNPEPQPWHAVQLHLLHLECCDALSEAFINEVVE